MLEHWDFLQALSIRRVDAQTVRPEFLNRVDELITFRPLSQGDVREIVKLQLHMLLHKLEEKDIQSTRERIIAAVTTTGAVIRG